MRIIVISESLIIRKGIIDILSKSKSKVASSVNESHMYTDIYKHNYDLMLIDINKNTKHYLYDIEEVHKNTDTKIMILDFYEDKNIFSKCMKIGIDGYILATINAEDIVYAVGQLSKNKKYYDSDFIDSYIKQENFECIDILTNREKEILATIAEGKNNLEIAKKFFITEHTVKKHISNIFNKLNVRDRTQAALYARENGIIT